ncbi:MAG: tRNA-dihydrouridine synthase B [Patescibacteria group bacterium]|jgi:tRNA-dihydrouridine synthase B
MVYRIGNLELKNRIFLSPLHEVNDIAFRSVCQKAGAGLVYTGLSNPRNPTELDLDDKPALQLFGTSIEGIAQYIKRYDDKVSLWDFNLGCPSKLSGKLNHGAFMHKELETLREIFSVMRKSTDKPCTIKLRKSPYAIAIAKIAEEVGFDGVGIHARTKSQNYSDEPDYLFALELKKSLGIPVIYSGNVNLDTYEKILEDFDFCYVARAAMGNPNIFIEMGCEGEEVSFVDYLQIARKHGLFFRQIKAHAMMFTHGKEGAKKMRFGVMKSKTIDDIERIFGVELV